jgi:NADH-quinone oxidoreductase subunit E
MNLEQIEKIVSKFDGSRGGLIAILEAIQSKYGYLPKEALEVVSQKTGKPMVDIFGVATFYKLFSLKPKGKHVVSVCLGTACHVHGAPKVAAEFEKHLCVCAGETTKDKQFTLETVNCLGACALGPIVVADGHYFSHTRTTKVKEIITKVKEGLDKVEVKSDKRIFPVAVSCPKCNHSLMDNEHKLDDKPGIRITVSFGGKHGWLLLSSLYGSFSIDSEHEIPFETVVHFFCPYCHAELASSIDCPECDAPMIPLYVKGGGVVQICSRKGCKAHLLDLHKEEKTAA